MLEFLRRHSSTPLPQALEYLVADVARRHGRLRVGGATTYLRGDPAMVAGAVRSAAGRRLGLRELAPGVAVTGRSQRELLAALRKAGEAPLAEEPDGSPRPEGPAPSATCSGPPPTAWAGPRPPPTATPPTAGPGSTRPPPSTASAAGAPGPGHRHGPADQRVARG